MIVESASRPELTEVELPAVGEWVSFWLDGKRHTLVADEPGTWTLLRHRKKAPTTLATFVETDAWFAEVDADGRTVGHPAPSWRALALRYL